MMRLFGGIKATRAAAETAAKEAEAQGQQLLAAIEKNREIAAQAMRSCSDDEPERKLCRA